MTKATRITISELILTEKLEIWRRRIRVILPDRSEQDIRNKAYSAMFSADNSSNSGKVAQTVYDAHFSYLLEVLSLPLRVIPDTLLISSEDAVADSEKHHMDIDTLASMIHVALQQQLADLKQPDTAETMWLEEYSVFSKSVEDLNKLTISEIREQILSEPVGLALSGGGIRSASFNLGLIESLKKSGLTDRFDYLSTVSGGGYIGTAWSVNSTREQSRFPFKQQPDNLDDERIQWLRSHGSYLTRGREINTISFVASIFKGVFINALVWLPPLLVLFWLLAPKSDSLFDQLYKHLLSQRVMNGADLITSPYFDALYIWTFITLAFFSLYLLQASKQRRIRPNYTIPITLGVVISSLPALLFYIALSNTFITINEKSDYGYLALSSVLIVLSIIVILDYFRIAPGVFSERTRFRLLESGSWVAVGGAALALTDPVMQLPLSPIGYVLFFAGLMLAAKLAINVIFMSFLSASSWRLHAEDQRMFAVQFGDLMMLSLIFLVLGGLPEIHNAVNDLINQLSGEDAVWKSLISGIATLVGSISTILGWIGRSKKGASAITGANAYLLRIGVTLLVAVFVMTTYSLVQNFSFSQPSTWNALTMASLAFAVVSWLALVLFSDINHISMHFYYRNRLADAFLSHPQYDIITQKCNAAGVDVTTAATAYLCGFDSGTSQRIIDRIATDGGNRIDLLCILKSARDPVYAQIHDCISKLDNHKKSIGGIKPKSRDNEDPTAQAAVLCGYNKAIISNVITQIEKIIQASNNADQFNKGITDFVQSANLTSLGPEFSAQMPMACSNIGRSGAPFHLINTNLVLVGSHNPELKARYGDSFVFTPRACGAKTVNWSPSSKISTNAIREIYEHGAMSFSTAMAISGAAVDSNVGSTLSTPLRIMMTLFNVRLGYWKMSPRVINRADKGSEGQGKRSNLRLKLKRLSAENWLSLIVREMFGLMNENSDYVRLSDGGHFENLGLYELIRRRCTLIVVSDAGADPNYQFEDLAKVILRVRTDFGVDIKLDYAPLKMTKDTNSGEPLPAKTPVVEGSINYPATEGKQPLSGRLILIKTNVFQDLDSPDVLTYASSHKAFPDESTADQFFDESQFEAYRQLGKCAGELAAAQIKGTTYLITVLDLGMAQVYRRFQELV